jgi:pSer/pThr/pTyr-binding forkhead associated (FHA) protein
MATLFVKTADVHNRLFELRLGVNRVGRDPENHLQIDHPTVSSLHCELVLSDNALVVRDCNSTNGTYVHGQRVMEAALRAGETFQLGDVEVLVETTEVTVAIPRPENPPTPPPVVLPDGTLLCRRHPKERATYQCTQCLEVMCDQCVHHLRRAGGETFHLCPHCSKPCQRMWEVSPPKKKSVLDRFKDTIKGTFTGDKSRGQ